jgi:hypothetical protein
VPKVFEWNGYRFHFFADEGNPLEPIHIHVRKGRDNAKFWLQPQVTLAYNRGFSPHVLSRLVAVIEQRSDEIEEAWNGFFH